MKNNIVCATCVMDTSSQEITFDEKGVCNYCRAYEIAEKTRKLERTSLPWIIYRMKMSGNGKPYDCLLGLSGGVDSSLCLVKLIENGLRPLCFSLDNGWNTPEADENVKKLVEHYKVPFYKYPVDYAIFKELQLAFIKSGTSNIEIPTDHLLMAVTYELARKNNIEYVVSGGNLATESIMPSDWGYNARDLRFIKSVYKTFTKQTLSGVPTISLLQYLFYRFVKKIKIINLLDYYEYNREAAKQELKEKVGWKDYGEKHAESKFTKWFQNMYLPRFFGYDKRKPHLSSLICSKQISRNDALLELAKPLEQVEGVCEQFPELLLDVVLVKKTYKDYKNSEKYWNFLSKMYSHIKHDKR